MIGFDAYRSALDHLDAEAAAKVIGEARRDGWSAAAVIEELIGPAQTWIGEQWEVGNVSIAKEHAVTAINGRLLAMLDVSDEPSADRVLVASAEGDWHSMACRMVSTVLHELGFATTSLDGPLPAGQLLSLVHEVGPRCVVICCVMEANLPGVRRVASVVREAGVPVLVGGRALDPTRAVAVGGDAFVESVSSLGPSIERIPVVTYPVQPLLHGREDGFEWMEAQLSVVAAQVSGAVAAGGRRAQDAVWLVRALHAALMCDEPRILTNHVRWMRVRASVADGADPDEILAHLREVLSEAPRSVAETIAVALDAGPGTQSSGAL